MLSWWQSSEVSVTFLTLVGSSFTASRRTDTNFENQIGETNPFSFNHPHLRRSVYKSPGGSPVSTFILSNFGTTVQWAYIPKPDRLKEPRPHCARCQDGHCGVESDFMIVRSGEEGHGTSSVKCRYVRCRYQRYPLKRDLSCPPSAVLA